MHVIKHEPDVAVDIPVEPYGGNFLIAAGRAVHESQPVVEIDHAVAPGNLERTPGPVLPRERLRGNDAAIGGSRRIVGARFTGYGPTCLYIAAVEVEVR